MFFLFGPILLLILASQLYWGWQLRSLARRYISSKTARWLLAAAALALYAYMWDFNAAGFRLRPTPVRLTLADALLAAPFAVWIAGSLVGFLLVAFFTAAKWLALATIWTGRQLARRPPAPLPSPARRQFLERTANALGAAPFVAGSYGLLYGRLNLETTHPRIAMARLPRAFHGFRVAQLSDIHIGPFMTFEQIRKYVAIANREKPDLIVLTGDFVTWEASPQQAVVDALRGLRAPFGVYGCLGNHEAWAGVEDSITALFAATGVRILRQQAVPIATGGDRFNLIGVDFQTRRRMGSHAEGLVARPLEAVAPLLVPGTANILLSHNPDTFDRAAELAIDLSLAGHTHGGQAALEYISPEIAPSRLMTPYVAGHFRKPGGQLYVNRGIGTIGVPIRIGAPPEITIYEFVRA
jgi:predicted MPP superfamily phosphohydrolase